MAGKTTTTTPLGGYGRVSRVSGRDGDSYLTPAIQAGKIQNAAKEKGVAVASPIVMDEDVSGAKPVNERGLGELLARCERGELGGIIAANLDRLTRGSKLDEAEITGRLAACGARLILVDDNHDSATAADSPYEDVTLEMRAMVARMEWRKLKKRWADTVTNRIAAGVYIAVQPPFGYRKAEDGGLVPDEATAPIVREVFRRRARGES